MAPAPKEHPQQAAPGKLAMEPVSDDEIVISGVSGLLPNCDSFQEFSEKLYNKENMVTKHNARWKELRHPELSPYAGMVRGLAEFDAQFFTVFYTLAHSCEPVARLLFEQTYQAVFDAGICPSEIYGQRIGVFMAASLSESEKMCSISSVPLGIIGVSRTMFANRISYWLNLKGPSMTVDGDACGTIVALENAYHAMMSGYCDAAIVGSGKLILHPQTPIIYNRSSPLNPDGKTKCYDAGADGQSLSEAINVFFLQKYKDAKRVYAFVKHAKAMFGTSSNNVYSEQPTMPRDVALLSNFYRDFYNEARVSPSAVEYIEGFGAADLELDKLELQAIDQVFCKERREPLLVGSVASNIGFTEASAASCAIFKLLLAYQRGELAANLHCENPRQDVAAIRDGRMRIVTEHARFGKSYAALNALSMTGINAHALLQGFRKEKDWSKYQSTIPYLVMASGRQESAVQKILDDIESRRLDPEEIALIHNIYKTRISKHLSRGYAIYSTKDKKTITHNQKVDYYDDAKRPLWFVYSGMGSQWVGMGAQLMRIPIFAASIARCQRVLESKGVDLVKIITSEDKSTFDNILHSFVGISAIQVALTDLLTAIGLVPDKIIGHSLGEAGCAYADGCFSTEEVMMLSYIRGLVSISTELTRGAMAAIGLGSKQISKICPAEIDVACHNNSTSSTISGPIDAVQKFVEQLTAEGVFAKEVQCSNIAYHSRYVAKLGPDFLKMAKEVVKTPKIRSSRWISSSIPAEKWDDPVSNLSSAEYHTNNLLNSVLFEEALRFVPSNAVLVEIAPHGLLQAILKRAIPVDCRTIPLTRRGHPDNALFFLEAIGNLYMQGYDPDISALYPKIEFPVSSSTRPLSHLVEWVHAEKWKLCRYINPKRASCAVFKQIVTVADDEFQYLKGHHIEGIRVLPFAACLVAVWDTLAMTLGKERRKVSVQFIDVKFHSQPPLFDEQLNNIVTTVQRGSGKFEVYDGKVIIVEGVISVTALKSNAVPRTEDDISMCLSKEDIYKMFFERGYEYKDQFRSIHSMNTSMTEAEIQWQDNWVTFIDGILQMHALRCQHSGVSQPSQIKRLLIDVKENRHERNNSRGLLRASYDHILNKTSCGGVTTEHIFFTNKPTVKRQSVELQTLQFVPYECKEITDIGTAIGIMIQIVAENVNKNKISVFAVNVSNKPFFVSHLNKIKHVLPEINIDIVFIRKEDILESKTVIGKHDVVFLHDLLSDKKIFESLHSAIPPNTFVSSVGVDTTNLYPTTVYNQVAAIGNGRSRVELARFRPTPAPSNTTAITVRTMSDLHQLRNICEQMPIEHKILVLSPHPVSPNLKDQVIFWRKTCQNNISMAMFDQKNAMDKKMERIPDMAFTVLHDNNWGGDYYVPTRVDKAPTKSVISLTCTRPGDLSSLGWVERDAPNPKQGIEVTVHYSGLVVNDASRALAEISVDSSAEGFGMDFSGVTASGERVMGLMMRGSAASKVRADPRLLWPVPKHWSLEDAATVPYAYCHALYLMGKDVLILPMATVLVHGGAGALGQALITLLLARGCRVFVTVSDARKKHFLRKLFPELKDEDIGNSRDDSFKDMIMRATNGEGVFQVFSCVKGDLRNPSIACCSTNGCIKDTTQIGTTREDFDFGLNHLNKIQHYFATDFSSIFTNENRALELRKLQLLLSDFIIKGVVRPLSRVTYSPHEVPRAFRLLAASRHRGRVLIAMREPAPLALPKISCQPKNSYLVLYDDEDFGLQVADLLVKRGAMKIYLQANQTSYLSYKIRSWEELKVDVKVSSSALSKKEDILTLLKNVNNMGALSGIYLVSTSATPRPEYTSSVLSNLDSASRKMCPNLCHFAVISEDDKPWRGIINERVRNGLPGLSLQLAKLERFDSSGGASNEAKSSNMRLLPFAAIQAVEEALYSGNNVIQANVQQIVPRTILEEVAQIPGVNITNATVDRTPLEVVGVDHGRVRELCTLLQEKFNITISPDVVPRMTIGQLKQLKIPILDVEAEVAGFGAYINTVDQDEMMATNELMLMPTLVHNSELRADEFDIDHDYLCIIPGLEGHHARFSSLCERLKLPAVVLQLGHNHLQDSLEEIAQRCVDTILKNLKPQKKFYVLGYEFGALIALEVAAILESHGMTGTVYMLGGTPQDIRSSFAARWNSSNEVAMEDALVKHLHHLITHSTSSQLEEDLRSSASWQDKVEALIRASRKKVAHSSQYIRGITEGIYSRIKLLQAYRGQKRILQSKIVLMQAKSHTSSIQTVQSFTNQEPVVKSLLATLPFAHKDLSVPNIINSNIDPDILEAFSKSNQCITALINDDEYLKLQVVQDW